MMWTIFGNSVRADRQMLEAKVYLLQKIGPMFEVAESQMSKDGDPGEFVLRWNYRWQKIQASKLE
jgi:hypothetical protein